MIRTLGVIVLALVVAATWATTRSSEPEGERPLSPSDEGGRIPAGVARQISIPDEVVLAGEPLEVRSRTVPESSHPSSVSAPVASSELKSGLHGIDFFEEKYVECSKAKIEEHRKRYFALYGDALKELAQERLDAGDYIETDSAGEPEEFAFVAGQRTHTTSFAVQQADGKFRYRWISIPLASTSASVKALESELCFLVVRAKQMGSSPQIELTGSTGSTEIPR
jgi:hypothetical protein